MVEDIHGFALITYLVRETTRQYRLLGYLLHLANNYGCLLQRRADRLC